MTNPFDKTAFWNMAVPAEKSFLDNVHSCLIVAPHPDDESLGCGGLIAKLRKQHCLVNVVITTDGSQSHPNSSNYPEKERIEVRSRELIHALQVLEVDETNIHFLEGKDAAFPQSNEPGFDNFKEKLKIIISRVNPQLCLIPYELDPHCDHRSAWQLLNAALGEVATNGITVWEYPIWLYEIARPEDLPVLKEGELKYVDIDLFIHKKREAIAAHVSQTTDLINDDPHGFVLSQEMINNFLTGREYFIQRDGLKKENTLSADYFQSLYQNNTDPWNFEKSEYESEKYRATINYLPESQYLNGLEIGCSIGVLTNMLRKKCKALLSIDISETALAVAKKRLQSYPEVAFRVAAVPQNFPIGNYNLIVMSEVGYYLSMTDLLRVKKQIIDSLLPSGTLILVHWTHYVSDYPLSGDQVHETFITAKELIRTSYKRTDDYRLDVFIKR